MRPVASGMLTEHALTLSSGIPPVFFDGWPGIVRVLLTAPILYVMVIVFVRVSGKRSTSQLNNFDWVLTVAMGSMVASPILLDNVVLTETLTGIGLLLLLQFFVTKLSRHHAGFERLVKTSPAIVVFDGVYQDRVMDRERITRAEVMASLRQNGLSKVEQAALVILESDAHLSVLRRDQFQANDGGLEHLKDVGVGDLEIKTHGNDSAPHAAANATE